MALKLDACNQVSKAHSLDENQTSGWLSWVAQKVDDEKLEMAQAWLCDMDLLIGANSKDLPSEKMVHRF